MAYYAYKRACYQLIPSEWRDEWEARFKELADRAPDGDANYDGDNWIMVADYIEHLQAQLAKYEQDWAAITALGMSLREEKDS